MSEKQAKRRRANIKLAYIAEFYVWLDNEPPRYMFVRWHKCKKSRPDIRKIEKEMSEK